MCNLKQISAKDDIEVYFRAMVGSSFVPKVVGPFGDGAFLRPGADRLELVPAQWGMIAPGAATRRPSSKAILTNNARTETVASKMTFRDAWRKKQRCLIPVSWYMEPNWETSTTKSIPWHLRRADGLPWALAGLWSSWVEPDTGEVIANYTLLTMNCDAHPMLKRLHKPDPDLPADAQDKRAVVHVQPEDWECWLLGEEQHARALFKLPPAEFFDQADVERTDEMLARKRELAPGSDAAEADLNLPLF